MDFKALVLSSIGESSFKDEVTKEVIDICVKANFIEGSDRAKSTKLDWLNGVVCRTYFALYFSEVAENGFKFPKSQMEFNVRKQEYVKRILKSISNKLYEADNNSTSFISSFG
ncbi:hypothetical protein KUV56_08290 [Ferrimonas balearica]|uniref:hypothetical protein n=1 Tax=Ferrimonas balearica TaxID=44012 RepID=UPI001C59959B|nr:hypothetical protein [Ferrimonas balearica]MBW3139512.1 hypothetical protein [Ferrimonas balearica]